jgi:DNA-binding transcriptional MocR family regulator
MSGLNFHLDRARGRVRDRLMDALRDAIRSGRLLPGTRLPSSRTLAADLGLARNTVPRAYAELVVEGWLTSEYGSGSRVSPRTASVVPSTTVRSSRPTTRRLEHDLRPGHPDLSSFPVRSGAGRSSGRYRSPHQRRSFTPIHLVGLSSASRLRSTLLALGECGRHRTTSWCAAAPPKE